MNVIDNLQTCKELRGRVEILVMLAKVLSSEDLNILCALNGLEQCRDYLIDVGPELEANGDAPILYHDDTGVPEMAMAIDMMDDQVCAVEMNAVVIKIFKETGIDLRTLFRFRRVVEAVRYEAVD